MESSNENQTPSNIKVLPMPQQSDKVTLIFADKPSDGLLEKVLRTLAEQVIGI